MAFVFIIGGLLVRSTSQRVEAIQREVKRAVEKQEEAAREAVAAKNEALKSDMQKSDFLSFVCHVSAENRGEAR